MIGRPNQPLLAFRSLPSRLMHLRRRARPAASSRLRHHPLQNSSGIASNKSSTTHEGVLNAWQSRIASRRESAIRTRSRIWYSFEGIRSAGAELGVNEPRLAAEWKTILRDIVMPTLAHGHAPVSAREKDQ